MMFLSARASSQIAAASPIRGLNQLDRQDNAVTQCVAGYQLDLGLGYYSGQYLEALREAGTTIRIPVLALAVIAPDVPIQPAKETFASVMSSGLAS